MANNNENGNTLVLITGCSGYIGSHCVKLLLNEGYRVRGTVRSLKNSAKVDPVKILDTDGRLELVEADLLEPSGWKKAVKGCQYVLHVASPFPLVADEGCIKTAIEGTLNVLKAVAENGNIKKVVLTSSCAAVNEGQPQDKIFDETNWTNIETKGVDNYTKSKTLAEREAWNFLESLPKEKRFALTVINPTLVFGPMLITEQGASISLIRRFMDFCQMPATPPLNMALVDVRDVARAHLEAMRRPETDGERILVASTPSIWFRDIARTLRKEFSSQGYKIPRVQAPYFMVWMFSFFDAEAASSLPRLNIEIKFNNRKSIQLLGLKYHNVEDTILEMAYSAIEQGVIKKSGQYKSVPKKYQQEIIEEDKLENSRM
ncbi:hypothetical protein WR25_11683 [Diploscapter pachys]|uniref:NAD-dependent epimerase/dehydratase domain-containing protein n=1 Tax=Diploscapter pachys TaxID=2018661 RepID=A0A2A2KPI8_9BILA|nr:hypothetical protein WR25_11683 [Diploscapter pachys]